MGRGRAKAKQTKVARDLKYRTHETDLQALADELHGRTGSQEDDEPDPELIEKYSDFADSDPQRD